ncbi:MAG: type I restriction-modification system endonuclease [Candidatus Eremiobacteraeota bacterium]|nr:type I restriction-modification system endonuclease [Candidatus Eremiobacteraeota bacterium]
MAGGANFGFLEQHDPQLMHLAQRAERYLADDPNTCLIKLRQFGELLIKHVAAQHRLQEAENFAATIHLLQREGVHASVIQGFHDLRRAGNDAVHGFRGDHQEALLKLKTARAMGTWYHRVTKDRSFEPGPFVPPPSDDEQLQQLQDQLQQALLEKQRAQNVAETEAQARAQAELKALQAAEEAASWKSLAEETTSPTPVATVPLEELKTATAQQPLDEDEADTRIKIDAQLRAAGWQVDSVELRYAKGARPQQGKSLAIAEYPTPKGPADYVLFLGLTPVAIVEAKRKTKDVSASLEQARRYAKALPDPIPFLFATNGRPYLRQLIEKSGVWFRDERRPQNRAHALKDWYTPKGLEALLAQDLDQAHQKLEKEPFAYLQLRDYQIQAIQSVEAAIAEGKQDILLAMATGTGKTRTAIGLIYRLLKSKRFRRILFLVDRTALGNQSFNAFEHFRLEQNQTFTETYDVKSLGDVTPDETTKVHIATIQATIQRALESDEANAPVDQYDCILVDECHRGYSLDRELTDNELTYKNEQDYISQYRRALDHFDAVRIGLTATPALHTTEIFGPPIFLYSYRQAVIDGYLVDHEPPLQIVTKLAQDGMVWPAQSEMLLYNTQTQMPETTWLPDEVKIDLEKFNKTVLTENFNQAVCQELARHIDPTLPGKTLVFCATDLHADMVVRLLKEAFEDAPEQAVVKITGASDKPNELIRRFKNEQYPSVAVTVDLLTTGVDVPQICHIVFLRRVKSRILYQQMIGRATRLCKDFLKESFHIYDAVELYKDMDEFSDMKPVVVNPKTTVEQLVRELTTAPEEARHEVLDQLLAKLQRKKRSLQGNTFQELAGQTLADLIEQLRGQTPEQVATYFGERFALVSYLDTHKPNPALYVVSTHEDEVAYTAQGFGPGNQPPADYLEGFAHFIQQNLNEVAALTLVTQRPRDLTREDLRQLRLLLDNAGFSETQLKAAYRRTTNQDIAASIIGFIRQKALGSPLIPYEERVDKALKKVLSTRPWTDPQRKWLDRIAKQLKKEVIVDHHALDQGEFAAHGGFQTINKKLDGQLANLLAQFQDAIWDDVA